MKTIELTPIKEKPEDFEAIEKAIIALYRKYIYEPLLKSLGIKKGVLKNSDSPLIDAIGSGRVTFSRGKFSGSFNSRISKELKALGAKFDRKTGTWKIQQGELPYEVRSAVSVSEARLTEKFADIDKKLAQVVPAKLAEQLSVSKHFDTSLWRVEKDLDFDLKKKALTISPKLSPDQRRKVADEWQENMRLWIQDFTAEETTKLRKMIKENVFAGNRRESMIKTIQESFNTTRNKAKFLARQETSLLMTKYKQTRYQAAGSNTYKWGCVKMPHQGKNAPYMPGEVRHYHGILEGKTFEWNNPPITNEKGSRNNPGQDYNCRCFAIPIVSFKTE